MQHQVPPTDTRYGHVQACVGGSMPLPHCCIVSHAVPCDRRCRHVQLMMLRRHLASLGVELTDEEAAMLTTAVSSVKAVRIKLGALLLWIMGPLCSSMMHGDTGQRQRLPVSCL